MQDVVHGLVTGQEVVDVCDDVDADIAEEILGLIVGCLSDTQKEEEREEFEHDEAWRTSAGELTLLSPVLLLKVSILSESSFITFT